MRFFSKRRISIPRTESSAHMKRMFGSVVAVVFQIVFRAEKHVNNVSSFFKNYFWYQHIKTIQKVQTALNFSKKKKKKILNFFKKPVWPQCQTGKTSAAKKHFHGKSLRYLNEPDLSIYCTLKETPIARSSFQTAVKCTGNFIINCSLIASRISLQDFTVLPTAIFRRCMIERLSVKYLPTILPTEYARQNTFCRWFHIPSL